MSFFADCTRVFCARGITANKKESKSKFLIQLLLTITGRTEKRGSQRVNAIPRSFLNNLILHDRCSEAVSKPFFQGEGGG